MSATKNASEWTPQDVATLLHGMGLGAHADRFIEEGVNGQVLLKLTGDELKHELGVTRFGERKQLLDAIGELATSTAASYPPDFCRKAEHLLLSRIMPPPGPLHSGDVDSVMQKRDAETTTIPGADASRVEEVTKASAHVTSPEASTTGSPRSSPEARACSEGTVEETRASARAFSPEALTTGSPRSSPEARACSEGTVEDIHVTPASGHDGAVSSSERTCTEVRKRFKPFLLNTWRSVRFGILGIEGVEEAGGQDFFVNVTWRSGSGRIQLDGKSLYFHIIQPASSEVERCSLKFRPLESHPLGPAVWGEGDGQDLEIWHLEPPPPPPEHERPPAHLHQLPAKAPPPPPPHPAAARQRASEDQRVEAPPPQCLRASSSSSCCPTPGCPYPRGGNRDGTYCCNRCELAHQNGGPLDEDPVTGERWKKPHGGGCTKHWDRVFEPSSRVVNEHPVPPRVVNNYPVPPPPPPPGAVVWSPVSGVAGAGVASATGPSTPGIAERVASRDGDHCIVSMVSARTGWFVDSLRFTLHDGSVKGWGGAGGYEATEQELRSGEYIQRVDQTNDYVGCLGSGFTFYLSSGRQIIMAGTGSKKAKSIVSVSAEAGQQIYDLCFEGSQLVAFKAIDAAGVVSTGSARTLLSR